MGILESLCKSLAYHVNLVNHQAIKNQKNGSTVVPAPVLVDYEFAIENVDYLYLFSSFLI